MVKLLLFGDLHLRKGHLQQGESTTEAVIAKSKEIRPDIIVLMGDVLHTHEMVYVKAFRLLEELIEYLRAIAKVYILVGNHDYINASENQTEEHPLGPFKKWKGVKVIDRLTLVEFENRKVVMSPYLPYGKFVSSLGKFLEGEEVDIDQVDLVLGHQPFLPVDPKAERWPDDYPLMFSGHIHDKCNPQENLYYTGSSCQVDHSEKPDKYACLLVFGEGGVTEHKYLPLRVRSVHLEKVRVKDLDVSKLTKLTRNHDVRLIIQGSREEKIAFEETKDARTVKASGIKTTWEFDRSTRDLVGRGEEGHKGKRKDFENILLELIDRSEPRVKDAYSLIFGKVITQVE